MIEESVKRPRGVQWKYTVVNFLYIIYVKRYVYIYVKKYIILEIVISKISQPVNENNNKNNSEGVWLTFQQRG